MITDAPAPSAAVQAAHDSGNYTRLFDGAAAVAWWRYLDERRGYYRTCELRAGDRRVQVSMSPAGRSVRVWVDGTEVKS